MEHDEDDVLILDDEVNIEFERAPSTEDLFRQIDDLIEETDMPRSRHVAVPPSRPAVVCDRPKRSHEPIRAPEQGVPTIVPGTIMSVDSPAVVASTSGLSGVLQTRLGPVVPSLVSRLGPVVSSPPAEEAKAKRPRGPDRRPEQYRALTQQGLATLRLPELVRYEVNRPFYAATRYNRNELFWRELTHKDRVAREHAEWNLHLQTPRQMPKISFDKAKRLIAETYKVGPDHKLDVIEFFEGQKVADTDGRVVAFEQEVRACGFMSFDTEGGGGLPSNDRKEDTRVFIAMSSPRTGRVFLFHCMFDVPKSLVSLLADYTVAKIQSNIAADVKILNDIGYDVRGLVDSGVLYTFIVPGTIEEGFGAKRQNQVLWPGSTHFVPYEYRQFNTAYQRQKLTERARRHVIQDVILPYAILFEATCRRVETDKKARDDIFPYVNELLELAYTREPTFVRAKEPKESARDYWLPPVTGNEYDMNSKADCTLVRRARAAYVENFDGPTLRDRQRSAEAIWSNRELPSTRNKAFRITNWSIVMAQHCHNCGKDNHPTDKCPTPMVPCAIPHYPGVTWHAHSVLCCPQLHSRCTICRMRGHLDQQHPLLELTPREFREDFFRFCHLGLYTSLPYLYETDGRLRAHHWKANLMMSRMPRGLGSLWSYKGVSYTFPQANVDQVAAIRSVVNANLMSSVYNYQNLLGNDPE